MSKLTEWAAIARRLRKWASTTEPCSPQRLSAQSFVPVLALVQLGCAASEAKSTSIYAIQDWNESKEGRQVTVHAYFFSDLHHGATLSDSGCPEFHLPIGRDSVSAHQSVSAFFDAMWADLDRYRGRDFPVEIVATYYWSKGETVNADLPAHKQLHIPPHGMVAIDRVLKFEQ